MDLIIKDQWKRACHFKIASFPVPTGLASEAIEVKEDNQLDTCSTYSLILINILHWNGNVMIL